MQPLFKEPEGPLEDRLLVAYLNVLLPWDNDYFRNIIPEGTAPLHLVLKNACGSTTTFEIDGPAVAMLLSPVKIFMTWTMTT